MIQEIARTAGVKAGQVSATLRLLDDGNTVPFIARYRKEATGNLDEVQIRDVARMAKEIRDREDRREAILRSIEEQGAMTDALRQAIGAADSLARLEDLYAPYRPRRRTRGQKAREAGLEPLARVIEAGRDPAREVGRYLSDEFPTEEDALQGACDILAEELADDATLRGEVRELTRKRGRLTSKKRRGASGEGTYEMYWEFTTPYGRARPHQVLAIRRGESEKELSAGLDISTEEERLSRRLKQGIRGGGKARELQEEAREDGFKRLLFPAVERDLRKDLEEAADKHAIEVFAVNLKNLLLQPPVPRKVVLGIDPGMRTGCKLAVVDGTGKLLVTGQCYVHDGRQKEAPGVIAQCVKKYGVELVAIGNGTGSRETEEAVAEALRGLDAAYTVVDEAGASVYSASDVARQEFPDLDVSIRGAVSIARRLQDPLAELVKIDPKSVGVGMYQHDVNQVALQEALDAVVEDVVNAVGVDLNSASEPLLARVAGLGPTLASRIVAFRDEAGRFRSRADLMKISGIGAKTFEQCAGFLRIREGAEPLDSTGIHPESYGLARRLLKEAGMAPGDPGLEDALSGLRKSGKLRAMAEEAGVGELTLEDIVDGLLRPGRDPREAFDPPLLRKDVLKMEDLREGMRLEGTVRNVVDFGAFVDIGVKQDGLVHVSEMADRYVKNPYEVVSIGDRVDVMVLGVDLRRGRIQLSMKG